MIIDRGIYSLDVFKDIIKNPNTHIITWENGYEKDKWDEKSLMEKVLLKKKEQQKGYKTCPLPLPGKAMGKARIYEADNCTYI